ncbi:hypothetical protein [Sorangium cellulosum]|uniref:hypothetical protein n=1 Tax=Sorangium cellulosum TaxID=56 RepID=UPI0012FFB640|nr:hypothetical protein [Sorangium cellulosum]
MTSSDARFAVSVGGTGLILAGAASAAFALAGVKAYGRKGILVPALVGLMLNGAFIAMAVLD